MSGGGIVQTLKKSYSLSDLSEPDLNRTQDEIDDITRPQRILRSKTTRSSSSGRNVDMYFPEVEVTGRQRDVPYSYIRSTDDISSGYSSAEHGLSRTASLSSTTARPRLKSKTREDDDDVFYDGRGTDIYRNNSQNLPLLTFQEMPDNRPISRNKIVEIPNNPQKSIPQPEIPVPKGYEDKYEMFLKWIEENQKSTNMSKCAPIHETVEQEVLIVDKGEIEVVVKDNLDVVNDPIPCDPKIPISYEMEIQESLAIFREESQNKESLDIIKAECLFTVEKESLDIIKAESHHNQEYLAIDEESQVHTDELFRDTISISSGDSDEFLDLENDYEPELLKLEEETEYQDKSNGRNSSVFEEAIDDEIIRTPSVLEEFENKTSSSELLFKDLENTEEMNECRAVEKQDIDTLSVVEYSQILNEPSRCEEKTPEVELKIIEDHEYENISETCLNPKDVLVEAKLILSGSKLQIDTSTSNLSSSTNSLTTSEDTSNIEERPPSRPSFHSKGKAPPIPPKKRHVEPSLPLKSDPIVRDIPKSVSPIPEPRTKDKEKRKSKLMSSITGIFKHDHLHHKEVPQQPHNSLHPSSCVEENNVTISLKETQI